MARVAQHEWAAGSTCLPCKPPTHSPWGDLLSCTHSLVGSVGRLSTYCQPGSARHSNPPGPPPPPCTARHAKAAAASCIVQCNPITCQALGLLQLRRRVILVWYLLMSASQVVRLGLMFSKYIFASVCICIGSPQESSKSPGSNNCLHYRTFSEPWVLTVGGLE